MKKTVIILFTAFLISLSIISLKQIDFATTSAIKESEYPTVIIDAGHGGEDGGAVAADGTVEKDINLSISLKLNEILTTLGYKTRMVRTADISIYDKGTETLRNKKISDIHNRANMMNEYDDCIYVSIHQNKYSSAGVNGAQTFYSPNDDKSMFLAQFIQTSIKTHIQPENDKTVKKSGTNIYVLYNATKPAVMVECGFLSNPAELEKLKNDEYQSKMAFCIASGIVNYFSSEE